MAAPENLVNLALSSHSLHNRAIRSMLGIASCILVDITSLILRSTTAHFKFILVSLIGRSEGPTH